MTRGKAHDPNAAAQGSTARSRSLEASRNCSASLLAGEAATWSASSHSAEEDGCMPPAAWRGRGTGCGGDEGRRTGLPLSEEGASAAATTPSA